MSVRFLLALLLAVVAASLSVFAGPYIPQGPFVSPFPGLQLPGPGNVPGKEYAAGPNHDLAGLIFPGQTLLWDGAGGIANGLLLPDEVDALAHSGDALYDAVVADRSYLLFSGYNMFSHTAVPAILWEAPGALAGGVWAGGLTVDQHMAITDDIVALEVWGPEGVSDANRYSLFGDPAGCSVNILGGGCLVTTAVIGAFLGLSPSDVDLDALMVNEAASKILFSIRAAGPYDGGEIWDFNYVTGIGAPLFHGGHLWDTAFDVVGAYGTLGITTEDISAIEAASTPEPSTLLMAAAGLLLVAVCRRRR